jgi:hypothetical protein
MSPARIHWRGGVPFFEYEPPVRQTPHPDFDAGARELPFEPPRVEWLPDPEDRGWQTVEIENGADWLRPGLGR